MTTSGNCVADALPLDQTIGYIVYESALNGRCVNVQPVSGLKECSGLCQSRTVHETGLKFNTFSHILHCFTSGAKKGQPDEKRTQKNGRRTDWLKLWFWLDSPYPKSECGCCTPVDTTELSVALKCADGSERGQNIQIPSSCMCQPCAANVEDIQQEQQQTKTKRKQRSDI